MIRTRTVALALATVASMIAGGTSVVMAQQSARPAAPVAPQAPVMRGQNRGYRYGGTWQRGRYGQGRRYYGMAQRGRYGHGRGMARYSRGYGRRYGYMAHPHGRRGMNRYGNRHGMQGRRMNGGRARHYHGVI